MDFKFQFFLLISVQQPISHLHSNFQSIPGITNKVMKGFPLSVLPFCPKNGNFLPKIRNYGFCSANFYFSVKPILTTDHLSPKTAEKTKRFPSCRQISAVSWPKSKKSAFESESGPPFWNWQEISKKKPVTQQLPTDRTFGESLGPIRPVNLEKSVAIPGNFPKVIVLVE